MQTRPRQVTVGGFLTVFGSVFALVGVFQGMSGLYSQAASDLLRDTIARDELASYDISLDSAREFLKYALMVAGVFAVSSLVLGWFALRGNRSARVALTVMGALTGLVAVFGGPQLWFVLLYVGAAVMLLWSRPARDWFDKVSGAAGGDGGVRAAQGPAGSRAGPVWPPAQPPPPPSGSDPDPQLPPPPPPVARPRPDPTPERGRESESPPDATGGAQPNPPPPPAPRPR